MVLIWLANKRMEVADDGRELMTCIHHGAPMRLGFALFILITVRGELVLMMTCLF
jgi:hypothetical protein